MGKQETSPGCLQHHSSIRSFKASLDERHCLSACGSTTGGQKQRRRKRCLVRSSGRLNNLGCVRSLLDGIIERPAPRTFTLETVKQPEARAEDDRDICCASPCSSGSLQSSDSQEMGSECSALVTPGRKWPIVQFSSSGGGPCGHAPWMQVYISEDQHQHHGQPVYISQDGGFVLYYWAMGSECGWWLGHKEDGVAAENMLAYLPSGQKLWWAFQDGKPQQMQAALSDPATAQQAQLQLRGAEQAGIHAASNSHDDHPAECGLHGDVDLRQRILDTKEKGEPLGVIVLQRRSVVPEQKPNQLSISESSQSSTNKPEAPSRGGAPATKKPRTCRPPSSSLVLAPHGAYGMSLSGTSSFLDPKSVALQATFLQQLAQEGVLVEDDKAIFARLAREAIRGSNGGMPATPPPRPTMSPGFGGAARERLLRI